VDIRCLAEPYQSGVGEYAKNLLERLPRSTPQLRYRFFSTAAGPVRLKSSAANVSPAVSRTPSSIFNASVRLLHWPKLDSYCQAGVVFLPSLQSVSVRETTRLAVTIHDLSFERYPEFFSPRARLWHRLVNPRWLCRRADAIFAVSEHTKAELVACYGISPELITVTYLGVDESFFVPLGPGDLAAVRRRYGLPERFILTVGNIEPRKNIGALVAAYDRLAPDADLVVVGRPVRGAYTLPSHRQRARRGGRVRFLGYVNAEDRPALYRLATCLAYPSFYEGFGLPALEAMACGTPVVATSATSLPEVVGDAALLVDPHDVADLAGALEALVTDHALAERLRRRGLQRATLFSWEETARTTGQVLGRLVG